MVVFDDYTQLVKVQRMEAWQEVARRIAHEIKNPLTPIQLSAQRIRRRFGARFSADPTDAKVFDECIDAITSQVDGLKLLVNEFSNFARLPAANPVPDDLNRIVQEAVSRYAGTEGVVLKTDLDPKLPPADIDREQFGRLLTNLIDNAVAAVRERMAQEPDYDVGHVELRTVHDAPLHAVRLEVVDDGIGIRPEDRRRIFEPYFSRKQHGTGLGLAIVSRIVADHRGYVRVHDAQPRGARFIVELPAAPERSARGADEGSDMTRLLIVDDEESIRRSLAGLLSDEGYDVATASDGDAALAVLREEAADLDLVLLDIAMPGRDGMQVLEEARGRWPELPFVMMSGHGTIETAVRATRLGAFDFIEKPLSVEKLLLTLQHALDNHRLASREPAAARAGAARPRDPRQLGTDPALEAADRAGGADQRLGADHGRERHRQGTRCAPDPPAEQARRRAVRRGELRSDPRGADRVGAVRSREGRLHRRDRAQARQVRAGRPRHDLPRRDRRHVAEDAGEGAARAAGVEVRAGGRHRADRGGRARDRGHQQGTREGDRRGQLPRGPVLPARGDPVPRRAAARAPRGHPDSRQRPSSTSSARSRVRA